MVHEVEVLDREVALTSRNHEVGDLAGDPLDFQGATGRRSPYIFLATILPGVGWWEFIVII